VSIRLGEKLRDQAERARRKAARTERLG
jgi:hypothetical protein